jgi:hypothetical protein
MLAFYRPADAVAWCGHVQKQVDALFRANPDGIQFRIRMGIETGVPVSVSPHKTSGRADYFGNIVNQTARIAKAARGGQILLGGDAWQAFYRDNISHDVLTRHPHRLMNESPRRNHDNHHHKQSDPSSDDHSTSLGTRDSDRCRRRDLSLLPFYFRPRGRYIFKGILDGTLIVEAIPVGLQHIVHAPIAATKVSLDHHHHNGSSFDPHDHCDHRTRPRIVANDVNENENRLRMNRRQQQAMLAARKTRPRSKPWHYVDDPPRERAAIGRLCSEDNEEAHEHSDAHDNNGHHEHDDDVYDDDVHEAEEEKVHGTTLSTVAFKDHPVTRKQSYLPDKSTEGWPLSCLLERTMIRDHNTNAESRRTMTSHHSSHRRRHHRRNKDTFSPPQNQTPHDDNLSCRSMDDDDFNDKDVIYVWSGCDVHVHETAPEHDDNDDDDDDGAVAEGGRDPHLYIGGRSGRQSSEGFGKPQRVRQRTLSLDQNNHLRSNSSLSERGPSIRDTETFDDHSWYGTLSEMSTSDLRLLFNDEA